MESYFTTKGIPFTVRDIRKDPSARKEWRERYGGEIVPTIVFDGGKRIVDGCDIPAIERTLRELAPATPAPR
ncbi:glutaredoxin family protein [Geomonas edaphica]|uniref:glutaredoxin family protein n=1 Tax=Geomonas edaphica TaxID=2570226 RepID=UPI0038B23F57